MKVAFDVNYADVAMGHVARKGHEIVCVAQTGEQDELWLERAMNKGAEVVFSRDLDIPNIIQRMRWPALWLEEIRNLKD